MSKKLTLKELELKRYQLEHEWGYMKGVNEYDFRTDPHIPYWVKGLWIRYTKKIEDLKNYDLLAERSGGKFVSKEVEILEKHGIQYGDRVRIKRSTIFGTYLGTNPKGKALFYDEELHHTKAYSLNIIEKAYEKWG